MFSRLLEGLVCGHVYRNAGERYTARNHFPVSLLSVIFEKLANGRLVDHLKKFSVFSDFQYSLRIVSGLLD